MRLSVIVVAFGKDELLRGVPRVGRAVARSMSRVARAPGRCEPSSPATRDAARLPRLRSWVEGGPDPRVRRRGRAGLDARPRRVDRARERRLPAGARRARRAARRRQELPGDRRGRRPDSLRRPTRERSTRRGSSSTELGIARERLLGEPAQLVETELRRGRRCERERSASSGAPCSTTSAGSTPTFFAYLEDADLAWRARMAGWRCVLAPRGDRTATITPPRSATARTPSIAWSAGIGCGCWRRTRPRVQLRAGLVPIVGYDLLYVAHTAVTGRTLTPLAGRLEGLAEWRRLPGRRPAGRRELVLPRSPGLRAALARNRVYRSRPV